MKRDFAFEPVDVRIMLAEPRHAQDDGIVAKAGDVEADVVLVLAQLDVERAGASDVARGDGASVDDKELDGLWLDVPGELMA